MTSAPRCYYSNTQEDSNCILENTWSLHMYKNWTRIQTSKYVKQWNKISTNFESRKSKILWALKGHTFRNWDNHLRRWPPIRMLRPRSSPFSRNGRHRPKRKITLSWHQQNAPFNSGHVILPAHSIKLEFGLRAVAGYNMSIKCRNTSRGVVSNDVNEHIPHQNGLIRATTLSLSASTQDEVDQLT